MLGEAPAACLVRMEAPQQGVTIESIALAILVAVRLYSKRRATCLVSLTEERPRTRNNDVLHGMQDPEEQTKTMGRAEKLRRLD